MMHYNRNGLLGIGLLFGGTGAYYMVCAMWLISIGGYPVSLVSVAAIANAMIAIVVCIVMVARYVAVRNLI